MTAPLPDIRRMPPSSLSPQDEEARAVALKQMQLVATGFLVFALVVFLVTKYYEPLHPWLGYIRATAEASLVGGLADWFAVTALFRRPLGLPIPHTAIMQTQKDRVGRILGNFVQNHFLSRAVLNARLTGIQPTDRISRWLADPEHRRTLARQLAGGLSRAVSALPEEEVREFVQRSAVSRLEKVQFAPLIGDILSVAAAEGRPQELLDEATKLIGGVLVEGRDAIRLKVRAESPKWLPHGVRDAIADRMVSGVQHFLSELAADRQHPMRSKFEQIVQDFIQRLKTSPELGLRAERIKRDLLGHPMVEDLVTSVWDRARRAAERYREDPENTSLEPLETVLAAVAESLAASESLRVEVDEFIVDTVTTLLEQHRQEVADLIAATVRDWDPAVAARRIELAVGRDLQFIRLNGTLVGGMAGLVIYVISKLL